jgi:DNA-binding transcriptional MerR regulator
MFTIGEFARLGRISVRMLRHYDATGLLRPAHVDPDSGYRFYTVDQLQRLNRLIALKDLGFKLDRVKTILDEQVGVEELKGMLRLRREELEAQISDDAGRLARVEARLRSIEREGLMTTPDVTIKSIQSVRVAELTGTVGSWAPEDIGPEIKSLFAELGGRLNAAGMVPTGMPLARYEQNGDEQVTVYADLPIDGAPEPGAGITVTELPPVERAATMLHHGSMDGVVPSYEALALWIEENGLRGVGLSREVTLACPEDPDGWVTELQMVVTDR